MSDPEFIMVSFQPPVDNWGRLLINPFTPPQGYAFATSGPFVYPVPDHPLAPLAKSQSTH